MRKPDRTLPALDRVEGCDEGLFERRLVDVWANGTKRRAWTDLFAQPLAKAQVVPPSRFPYHQAHARRNSTWRKQDHLRRRRSNRLTLSAVYANTVSLRRPGRTYA